MALFTVDSQNVFGKSVKEAGSYNVKVSADSEHKLTQHGEDMAVLHYEVVDGDYRGGRIMYDNFTWKNDDIENSEKRFNTLLVAMGVPDHTPIDSIQQLVQAVKGKTLNITVEWKQSNKGKWYLDVKSYQKTDPKGSNPNGVERPDSNQQAQNNQKSVSQQQSLPGVDPFNGITDDDLPF